MQANTEQASPAEAASQLLTKFGGHQRNAEVKAWEIAHKFDADSDGYRYWVQAVRHIVFGGEYPAVERRKDAHVAAA